VGGSEKHVVQSGMDEESLVMATPRRRRVEPDAETNVSVKNDKVTDRENLGTVCVSYAFPCFGYVC
jgi:hypothetical protein